MATIKSYTDLGQSKKLAEILPLKSADMFWYLATKGNPIARFNEGYNEYGDFELPCWSLAALLSVLSKGTNIRTPDPLNELSYCCWNQDDEIYADNPVDACYEMILKLKEQNLL